MSKQERVTKSELTTLFAIAFMFVCIALIRKCRDSTSLKNSGMSGSAIYMGLKNNAARKMHCYKLVDVSGKDIEFFDLQKKPDHVSVGDTVRVKYLPTDLDVIEIVDWNYK